jgi:hypothetical protein
MADEWSVTRQRDMGHPLGGVSCLVSCLAPCGQVRQGETLSRLSRVSRVSRSVTLPCERGALLKRQRSPFLRQSVAAAAGGGFDDHLGRPGTLCHDDRSRVVRLNHAVPQSLSADCVPASQRRVSRALRRAWRGILRGHGAMRSGGSLTKAWGPKNASSTEPCKITRTPPEPYPPDRLVKI